MVEVAALARIEVVSTSAANRQSLSSFHPLISWFGISTAGGITLAALQRLSVELEDGTNSGMIAG